MLTYAVLREQMKKALYRSLTPTQPHLTTTGKQHRAARRQEAVTQQHNTLTCPLLTRMPPLLTLTNTTHNPSLMD